MDPSPHAQALADLRAFLRVEVALPDETVDTLVDAGFDDFESLALVTRDSLQFLGLEDPDALYSKLRIALDDQTPSRYEGRRNSELAKQVLELDGSDIQDLQQQMAELKSHKTQQENVSPNLPQPPQPRAAVELEGKGVSLAMLVGAKEAKRPKAQVETLLRKLTHLHLENKRIEVVAGLELCTALSHVYLQENAIYTLVNEPFKGLAHIVQLNLYDNQIDQMEGFGDLVNLKKLYLEKNLIAKLDGLDNCRRLEELFLGHQQLGAEAEFAFDEYSLAAISNSLRVLDVPNAQIREPKPLYYLENLEQLNLRENRVEDFEHQVCPLLQTMNGLRTLRLDKNPVTQVTKYRDQVVLLSKSLQELDGRDINEQERQYLVNLISRKKVQATVYNDLKKKGQGAEKKFSVDGQRFAIHQQKEFLLERPRAGAKPVTVSFEEFQKMYHSKTGLVPESEDEVAELQRDYHDYLKFVTAKGQLNADAADASANASSAAGVGRSKNLNSNTDFTGAGVHIANTKHVPYAVRRGGN